MTAVQGKQRFKPAPLELAIKSLVLDSLRTRSADGENTTMKSESLAAQSCKAYVRDFIIISTHADTIKALHVPLRRNYVNPFEFEVMKARGMQWMIV